MTFNAIIRSLDEVSARLPFHVDDYEQANEAFLRWSATGADGDLEVVQLWVYCYTRRYFLAKFLRESAYTAADFDLVVGRAFTQAFRHIGSLEQPERFASWVSVICKNTFINFRRSRREHVALDEALTPTEEPARPAAHDGLVARRSVRQAIYRLPPALREVAAMKFLEGCSYETMSEATGRPIPSLRAFVNKAIVRLRQDPELRMLFDELRM